MTTTTEEPQPSLRDLCTPSDPRGVVLMLHGGQESGRMPVDGRSLSWRRSAAMGLAIRRRLARQGLAVSLLRYRYRGWDGGRDPVADARWALETLREQWGPIPVALLGHSMGARTAVRVADDEHVRGVVALTPWFPPGEPVHALAGRALVAAHGSRDRITSPRATQDYVARAARAGADASYVDMGEVGHYLLRRARAWNDLAATEAVRILSE